MSEIVQTGAPVLRLTAQTVPETEIAGPKIKAILATMSQALAKCEDGVALAAPQIGESLRIFIVAGKVLSEETPQKDLVFINPTITKSSRKKEALEEGCLSVRWIYGHVKRSTKVTVEAYDQTGKKFVHHGNGLLAQIFQHEIDHLNGILFTDRAENLTEIKPEQP